MLHRFIKRAFFLSGTYVYIFSDNIFAFVKSADGHDEFSVTGTLATGYDSNITSAPEGKSDFITSTTLGLDYESNAGVIGINGELS